MNRAVPFLHVYPRCHETRIFKDVDAHMLIDGKKYHYTKIFAAEFLSAAATWENVRWLKHHTVLPIVIKGILNGMYTRENVCAVLVVVFFTHLS